MAGTGLPVHKTMLARPIHTLQPHCGERLELQRLPHFRELIRQCATRLPLTSLEVAMILDHDHDGDIERLEMNRTCGVAMPLDDVKYRLKAELLSKDEFLDMTPIAGEASVFSPTSQQDVLYYELGATTDNEPISAKIIRKADTNVAINLRSSPTSRWIYIDDLNVSEQTLNNLFTVTEPPAWRVDIASKWPCNRGLRVSNRHDTTQMVLPPSLVSSLLDALVVSSGMDALLETYRIEGLPATPWTADADVTLRVDPPQLTVFNNISIKIPLHPLCAYVSGGRVEIALSVCGCIVDSHPSCLLCGRCSPWKDASERRTTFTEHCRRAGNRCLNRIKITIGKATGGAWTDKRSKSLCIRDSPSAMSLVETVADVIEFANNVAPKASSVTNLIECVSKLPRPVHVINDSAVTRGVTKLLRQNRHFMVTSKDKKTSNVVDADGNKLSKTIVKRYGWLFPRR